ncbi:VENN motif pre-toxin domain-containing protein [Cronobacter dublinensis]
MDKNSLDTGTPGYINISNKADYKVSHSGGGFSSSGSFGAQGALNAASTLMSAVGSSGHAQGTTQAAVSEGTITVRDKANQRQDVDGLQRDVTQANDAISPIFNKEKEQTRLQTVQMVSDIGNQVADIVRTQSDLDGLKAAIAQTGTSLQGLPEKERLAKLAALRDTGVYKKVTENTGTGSDVQRAITAATAAVSGLAGGNLNAALAGAAAPYIANEIGKNITEENTAAGIMAHAVVNAVLAKVQGQNALAGASGAAVGEAMGHLIAKEAYKKDPWQLNETEKQTVAALSTLASGLAGALAGNSTEAVATAAKAGQTTVENNFLHAEKITGFIEEQAKAKTPEDKRKLQEDIDELDKKLQAQAEGWGISTRDLKTALAGLKALEDSPECHAQCQGMVRDSISKLEPALENRVAKHSSQGENIKELTGILATAIVMHENGLIVGRTASSGSGKAVPGVTANKSGASVTDDIVTSEKAALDRIGQNSKNTKDLSQKLPNSVLVQQK